MQKEKISDAISINQQNLLLQREEMQRIEQFFSSFNDAIVLIGPEEKNISGPSQPLLIHPLCPK